MKKLIVALLSAALFVSTFVVPMRACASFVKPSDDILTSDDAIPTLSFDHDAWKQFVKVTSDGQVHANLVLKQEKTYRYQGGTLKIEADMAKAIEGDAATSTDIGIHLDAKDFGLENFDGCTISMVAKFVPEAVEKFSSANFLIYGADSDGDPMTETDIISKDPKKNGFVKDVTWTVPNNSKSAMIVIEFPLVQPYTGEVFLIDNMYIKTPLKDKAGKDLYVKNVDGFNQNAKVNEDALAENNVNTNNVSSVVEDDSSNDGKLNPITLVVIACVVVAAGLMVFIGIKAKNRFY